MESNSPKFKVGDEIQCISDPSRIGTVVEICESHARIQYYRVNFGAGGRPKKAEIDLRRYVPNPSPYENLINGHIDEYQEFQRLITYQRIIRENPLRNNIYAFNASRTRLFPYQFKPLLKFLDSPKHRLLIADEVGLGKTIEAGLILTELRARQTVQRVLVVCPANLTDKWRMELKKRFGEDFLVLDTQKFTNFLREYEESPNRTSINGILSLESIRKQATLEQIEALSPSFDLVIIDEAHHMRNFGRNQRKAGVLLSQSADGMLFLTATPVHLGSENLYSLLNILDDEEFPDLYTVDDRFRSNEPIIKAQICLGQIPPNLDDAMTFMEEVSDSPWIKNNPLHGEITSKLKEIENSGKAENRKLLLQVQRDLSELNLIGHIFTRTRKREVQTNMAIRKAYPLRLKFTDNERLFYDVVTDYVREQAEANTNCPLIQNWILIMPQRRMASSIPAMVEYYRKHFDFNEHEVPEDYDLSYDKFDEVTPDKPNFSSSEDMLRFIVNKWPQGEPDSKYDRFVDILRQLRKQEGRLKVMVFAFFKDTLRYLQRRLTEDGFKNALISGDIHPNERGSIVEKFENDEDCEILLSSKVGSEGLDFQFCNVLFNYDLPWNPMEVEQRIGRLDRIGQESPVIRIYNFWIEGTIEQRILDRLYSRIDIFERSVGELEMILGDELATLERDILSKKLSPEEEEKLIERKARIIEGRLDQLKKLEKESAQFIGTDHYFDEEVQMIQKHRRYITGEQMRRFIEDFIRFYCPKTRLDYNLDESRGKLYPDEKLRSVVLKYSEPGESSRYFASTHSGIPVTFESQVAFDYPNIDFINVLHPLTQSIVKYYEDSGGVNSNAHHVVLSTTYLDPGLYLYFIYKLRVHAARGMNTLEMTILNKNLDIACTDTDSEIILGEMVEKGKDSRGTPYEVNQNIAEKAYHSASKILHERISKIREDASRNNDAFIDRRLESLHTSYGKHIVMKRGQLEQAVTKKRQERYIRMLEGTIRRLESELEQKERDLQAQRAVEVAYDDIAAGILEVI
ncbi:MAG: helicase-related protein [Methanosarcinaceae archaeon]|nr:helicase-related protein [Methanosarcinaceae archaeon]